MENTTVLSAYRHLTAAQRAFVDSYVQECEREAMARNERLSLYLHRPVVIDQSRYLTLPMVQAAIVERISTLAAASELSVNRLIKELTCIAFSNIKDFLDLGDEGWPKFDLSKATPEQWAAVKSIEIEEVDGTLSRAPKRKIKITTHDKLAAAKMLTDYTGVSKPDNPYWAADKPVEAEQLAIPANMSPDAAGELYASMIGR
jgi:hypothetical protein